MDTFSNTIDRILMLAAIAIGAGWVGAGLLLLLFGQRLYQDFACGRRRKRIIIASGKQCIVTRRWRPGFRVPDFQ
jgi:hypothetical protein